jgi:hypothetical protein
MFPVTPDLVVLAAKAAAHDSDGGFHWSPWFTAVGVIALLLYLGYRGQQKKGD